MVAGIALDRALPLGRVYSFPKDLKCLNVEKALYSGAGDIVGFNLYAGRDLNYILLASFDAQGNMFVIDEIETRDAQRGMLTGAKALGQLSMCQPGLVAILDGRHAL